MIINLGMKKMMNLTRSKKTLIMFRGKNYSNNKKRKNHKSSVIKGGQGRELKERYLQINNNDSLISPCTGNRTMKIIPERQGEMLNSYNNVLGAKMQYSKTHKLKFAANVRYLTTSIVPLKDYF